MINARDVDLPEKDDQKKTEKVESNKPSGDLDDEIPF